MGTLRTRADSPQAWLSEAAPPRFSTPKTIAPPQETHEIPERHPRQAAPRVVPSESIVGASGTRGPSLDPDKSIQ